MITEEKPDEIRIEPGSKNIFIFVSEVKVKPEWRHKELHICEPLIDSSAAAIIYAFLDGAAEKKRACFIHCYYPGPAFCNFNKAHER